MRTISFPDGSFAWRPHDQRAGRYVVCPRDLHAALYLAVMDDFGTLVPVPGVVGFGGGTVQPLPLGGAA